MKKRPSPSPVLPQETLLEQGREFLRQGRSKEAVERFKLLVKRDPRPDWQALLYDAYVLRAQALADKGMVEEARLTLDNTRRPDGLPRQPLLYLTCLLRQQLFGKAAEFVQRCDGDWQEAIDADSRRRIVEIGAILALTDGPAEGAAATALDAWCSGAAADRVETALKGISLRSPLRPLRLILEALLTPEAERRDRLLGLVAADSPFAALRQAVVAAKADSGATLAEHWSGLSSAQQSFVAELRGLPPLRLRLWEQLRKAQTRSPQELLGVLLSHAKQFPPALLRCACADLLIDHPAALRQVENRLEPFSPMEKARIEALAAEAARDWPALKQAWQEVAELLSENGDVDGRLSLSLIYQHLADLAGKNPETVDEQADLLQKSLAADPEHLPTRYAWLQALQKQEDSEAWRQAIEDSLVRAPRDTTILAQAIEMAARRNAFKKAAGYAHRLLAIDPIHQQARRRMIELSIAHARKQAKGKRFDLAAKDLRAAEEWVRSGTVDGRLAIALGLIELRLNQPEGGVRLRGGVRALGEGVPGWLPAVGEALLMGWSDAEITQDFPEWAKALKTPPTRESLLTVAGNLRGGEIFRQPRSAAPLLLQLDTWLSRGTRLALTEDEFRILAETLEDSRRFGVLANFARRRGRNIASDSPARDYFRISARVGGDGQRLNPEEMLRLENLYFQAIQRQDMGLAERIGRLRDAAEVAYDFDDDPFFDDDDDLAADDLFPDMDSFFEECIALSNPGDIDKLIEALLQTLTHEAKQAGMPIPVPLPFLRSMLREEILQRRQRKGGKRSKKPRTPREFDF